MTTFQDGPAKGQTLMLRRTPIFLRVTEENGKWDALNEVDDTPRPGENLHSYIMARHVGSAHINCGRRGSGFYPIVEYHYTDIQAPDYVMRSTEKWASWVDAFAKRYKTHIEKLKL